MYDKLVPEVNTIDSSAKYDPDKSDLENQISDTDKKSQTLVDLLKK